MTTIFIVSAPSGSGKSTLVARLLASIPGLMFSVSYTTRQPRGHEVDGLDYHFVARDRTDWMARYFFTGGQMPSHELLMQFQERLSLLADWTLSGTH